MQSDRLALKAAVLEAISSITPDSTISRGMRAGPYARRESALKQEQLIHAQRCQPPVLPKHRLDRVKQDGDAVSLDFGFSPFRNEKGVSRSRSHPAGMAQWLNVDLVTV